MMCTLLFTLLSFMVRAKVPAEMSTADVVTLLEEWKMDHLFQEAFVKHGFNGYTLMVRVAAFYM